MYYDFEYINKTCYDNIKRFNGRDSGRFCLENLIYATKEEAIIKAVEYTTYYFNEEIESVKDYLKSLENDYQKYLETLK
jgi:hypothetical protein